MLEEIVGEIYDEEDAVAGADDADRALIQRVVDGDGAFAIKGEAELDDVRAALFDGETAGAPPPLDDAAFDCVTLSGFLCAVRGEIPADGDAVDDSGFRFTVVASDDRRVREVLAERVAGPAPRPAAAADDARAH